MGDDLGLLLLRLQTLGHFRDSGAQHVKTFSESRQTWVILSDKRCRTLVIGLLRPNQNVEPGPTASIPSNDLDWTAIRSSASS